MKYYIYWTLVIVGGLAFCVLAAMGLHVTYDPAPATRAELHWVVLPALGVLLFCAAGLLLMPGYNWQSRLDFSHDAFTVEAEGKTAGKFRRLFDWLFVPEVAVTVTLRDWQPCLDCFSFVTHDVRTLFGVKRLVVNPPKGTVELKVKDPQRRVPLLGQDFDELVKVLEETMSICQAEHHDHSRLRAV